jgi:aspartate/methionine/tyrosine aminotransferase
MINALKQDERLLSYSETQGELELREAIAEYIFEKRNVLRHQTG